MRVRIPSSTFRTGRWRRRMLQAGAVVLPLYLGSVALIYGKMCQPPEVFGSFMKHVPMPLLLFVPFETLWNRARGGPLRIGDLAPEFSLHTADRGSVVQLSSFRGSKPVVLIFGSYT